MEPGGGRRHAGVLRGGDRSGRHRAPPRGARGAGRQFFRARGELARDFRYCFARGRDVVLGTVAERGDYDLGEWGHIIRALAGYDPTAIPAVLRWPIREALLAYEHRLKRDAEQRYTHDVIVWALLAPHQKRAPKPPDLPPILKG